MVRIAALTGTPGTGKSTLAGLMARRGWTVIDLTQLARRTGAIVGRDEERRTDEVDVGLLREAVEEDLAARGEDMVLLVGHLAHWMPCDVVVVLRCSPSVLEARLEGRGWHEAKVRENVEAEAVGVILVEAMELEPPLPVYELDTTSMSAEEAEDRLEAALSGNGTTLEAGWVDWSEEVMGWY